MCIRDRYKGALDAADVAIVHYDPEAMKIKRMPDLPEEKVREAFGRDALFITNNTEDLKFILDKINFDDAVLLLMSSGNYGGLDLKAFAEGKVKKELA